MQATVVIPIIGCAIALASAVPDFIWADGPERGFVARTSAAVPVLLGFLVLMNPITIFLRNRSEGCW